MSEIVQPVFSIIIPYKGSPVLLKRCLDSIPKRSDVQVVVVEDVWGKGAGYARNQGLKIAKGKWLIFSDADDWFSERFDKLLDAYADSDVDVIYFKPKSAMDEPSERIKHILNLFEKGDEKLLRYMYITPWGKFIRRNLVSKNKFFFDEIRWSNDAFFMTEVAVAADKVLVTDDELYIVDEVDGSITHTKGCEKEEFVCRTKVDVKCYRYAFEAGFNPPDEILFYRVNECIKRRYWLLLLRTVKSLPINAYKSIKNRFLHQNNIRGRIVVNLVCGISKFVRPL